MAWALRAVSRMRPSRDAAIVLMDGNVLLTAGSLARSLPFLKLIPEVDAIVTDEESLVAGGPITRASHSLRAAERHQTMSSLGLSRRLPGIAGRISIHPAGVATDPNFIAALEWGPLEQGRRDRNPLLTGHDRSTWFWPLRRDRRMLYLPDVRILTIEHPPARRLRSAVAALLRRGRDDLRGGSSRAIALGPRRLGLFTWCSLIEQRVSVWTPLIGLLTALLFALGQSALFLYAYLLWVGTTRLIDALLLLSVRPRISGLYAALIYFGQIGGALIEAYRLARSQWQRGIGPHLTSGARLPPWSARLQDLRPAHLHVTAQSALIVAALSTSALRLPPLS
jgi:glycosyltransferase Alg8